VPGDVNHWPSQSDAGGFLALAWIRCCRSVHARGRPARQWPAAGLMFWFERNRFSGSYLALIRPSLA
jgi:hypothetical protein